MNRIEPIKSKINSTMDQEDQMEMIMEALNDTVTPIPEVGQYCTFVYKAKTPNIENGYDQHPLVSVLRLYNWGFEGINHHWEEIRRYTWEEIIGQVYIVKYEEFDDLKSIQYMKII